MTIPCDCCAVAREYPEHRQYNPACAHCGARYLRWLENTIRHEPTRDRRQADVLDTWAHYGHDRDAMWAASQSGPLPLQPVAAAPADARRGKRGG